MRLHPKHIHFIGICGTAMGSTAVALRALGHTISGSDSQVYPPMSEVLRDAGITVIAGYKPENLPLHADVVGNAISRGNTELEVLLEKKLPHVSMAEMLKREVIQGKRSFVVSGTHGKTTTMLAWVYEHAGKNPGFMIGSVPENFESGARFTHSDLFVIEGDEYDTAYFDKRSKFLHYLPECAIVDNIEFDHGNDFRVQKINHPAFKPDPPRSSNGPTGFRYAAQECRVPASALLGTWPPRTPPDHEPQRGSVTRTSQRPRFRAINRLLRDSPRLLRCHHVRSRPPPSIPAIACPGTSHLGSMI